MKGSWGWVGQAVANDSLVTIVYTLVHKFWRIKRQGKQ